ncbi:MAG: hypothetical protein H0W64_06205 [Gammaproteobacteria bacterium]|nr:hypothetical protein [Gammaproteobacteria bacterium]
MEDLLQRLEKHIKNLLDQHNQLKQSNVQLNQGKFLLTREKELLVDKQKKAFVQIEALVSKLKALGKMP